MGDFAGEVILRFKPLPRLHAHDDQADEYVITRYPDASSGLIEYALYRGEWQVNPWTSRPVVRYLLAEIDRLKASDQIAFIQAICRHHGLPAAIEDDIEQWLEKNGHEVPRVKILGDAPTAHWLLASDDGITAKFRGIVMKHLLALSKDIDDNFEQTTHARLAPPADINELLGELAKTWNKAGRYSLSDFNQGICRAAELFNAANEARSVKKEFGE